MSKTKITRRQFLVGAAATGIGMTLPVKFINGTAWAVNNSQNLTKWAQKIRQLDALRNPLYDNIVSIPTLTGSTDSVFPNTDIYNITAEKFTDQLHPTLPATTLWGYTVPGKTKVHLGGVFIGYRGRAARLRFTNNLPSQHILPIDSTIPGATSANRIAIHQHGGFVPWISDGGPFDWWLPDGSGGLSFQNGKTSIFDNLGMVAGQADYFYPNDQSCRLTWYHDHAHGTTRLNAYAGLATGYLILDAINASYYKPVTGFPNGKIPPLASTYPLVFQDKIFVSPNTATTDPTWSQMTIDPAAKNIGSLWYEHVYDPKLFKLKKGGAFLTPPNPSCIPEFFGDTMLANGLVYPTLTVEAKRYRFFILNACNARFLNINLLPVPAASDVATSPKTGLPVSTLIGPPITQIGSEGGFLFTETIHPNGRYFNPATLTGNLLLAPAERADVIIDFTGFAGKDFMMYNDAPGPFPVGPPANDYYLGNPKNPIQPLPAPNMTGPDTRNILRIKVVALTGPADPQPAGIILNPNLMDPPPLVPYTTTAAPIPAIIPPATIGAPYNQAVAGVKDLTLNEDFDQYGRLRQMIGTTAPALVGKGFGLEYLASPTEIPNAGEIWVWRIFNLTADTHPIHFHLVNVQVLSRQPFKVVNGIFTPTGLARGPEPNECGWKETVQMHPGEVTSVIMKFDLPAVPFTVPGSNRATQALNIAAGQWGMGLPAGPHYNEYVYHCHILEHEEHDMMRPLVVTGNPLSVTFVQEIGGTAGGTATYFISGGTGPYTVQSNNAAFTPVLTSTGFTVNVPAGTTAVGVGTPAATFTITDSATPTPATVTADLFIV
jgi:spore coat protein A, manganese oxidase